MKSNNPVETSIDLKTAMVFVPFGLTYQVFRFTDQRQNAKYVKEEHKRYLQDATILTPEGNDIPLSQFLDSLADQEANECIATSLIDTLVPYPLVKEPFPLTRVA